MKYPNIKPKAGEQEDVNERRYPEDNIELASPSDTTHSKVAGNSQPQNRPPAK